MTAQECKQHPEYLKGMDKIKSYPSGFEFTLEWERIPKGTANALKLLTSECIELGYIEPIQFDLNLVGECTATKFRRI